jgi:hypothetical protein
VIVTVLNEKGIPTPLVHTLLRAPQSRMDVLTPEELKSLVRSSSLVRKYAQDIDSESAHDILSRKIEEARRDELEMERRQQNEKASTTSSRRREKSMIEKVMTSTTTRQIGRTVARELTRGLLGVLGISSTKRRRR